MCVKYNKDISYLLYFKNMQSKLKKKKQKKRICNDCFKNNVLFKEQKSNEIKKIYD